MTTEITFSDWNLGGFNGGYVVQGCILPSGEQAVWYPEGGYDSETGDSELMIFSAADEYYEEPVLQIVCDFETAQSITERHANNGTA